MCSRQRAFEMLHDEMVHGSVIEVQQPLHQRKREGCVEAISCVAARLRRVSEHDELASGVLHLPSPRTRRKPAMPR